MRRRGAYVVAALLSVSAFGSATLVMTNAGAQTRKPVGTTRGARAKDAGAAASSTSAAAALLPTASDAGAAGAGGKVTLGDAGAPPSTSMVASGATPGTMDGATYAVRLRDLEGRVDELKDQIRRSHTRLALLSDTILSGGAAGSRAEVGFDDEMSSAFKLVKAVFVIDGTVQYNKTDDTGALADQKNIPIFSGSIPAGDHTVQVLLNFQGNGYGVFTYLKGYKFEVKSSHSFTAVEGKTLALTATALEKGGVTTPLEQRPAVEWHEKVGPIAGSAAPITGAPPGRPANGPASGSVSGSVQVGGSGK
jgi:hypothetical protein